MKLSMFPRIVLGILFAIATAIFIVDSTSTGNTITAGVLTAGILGEVKNKVGNVVGFDWKGINAIRIYKIPSNPNTPAQQAQRTRFAEAVVYSRMVLANLIYTFWDPFAVKMSGFNAFMRELLDNMDSSDQITVQNKMTKGSLEGAVIATMPIIGSAVTITWDKTISGNGLLTDNVGVVLYNADNKLLAYYSTVATRDDETVAIPSSILSDADNGAGFLFFYRGTGETFVVSDSDGFTAVP